MEQPLNTTTRPLRRQLCWACVLLNDQAVFGWLSARSQDWGKVAAGTVVPLQWCQRHVAVLLPTQRPIRPWVRQSRKPASRATANKYSSGLKLLSGSGVSC